MVGRVGSDPWPGCALQLKSIVQGFGSDATLLVFVDSPTTADETAAYLATRLEPTGAWTAVPYHAKLGPDEQDRALPGGGGGGGGSGREPALGRHRILCVAPPDFVCARRRR